MKQTVSNCRVPDTDPSFSHFCHCPVADHAHIQPDEKKETHKKKTPVKKKVETGSWPCKMNGCNKVFAREADLKRHQRTTKTHSMPGL